MSRFPALYQAVSVADPDDPTHVIKPNANGSINIAGAITAAAGILVYTPLGYQQIVGVAAATGLTVPATATLAIITVGNQPVRYRDDGVNPTATIGMPLGQDATLSYSGNLAAIKFIETAVSATLDISYYK